MNNICLKKRGFTLAEVMVAVFIITVGILAIGPLLNSVISSNILARNISIATHLARQRLEEIKTWPRYNYDPTVTGPNKCGIQIANPAWGGNGNCDPNVNPNATDGVITQNNIKVGDVPQFFTRITEIRSNTNLPAADQEVLVDGHFPLDYRIISVTVIWSTPFEVEVVGGTVQPRQRSITQVTSISEF